VTSRAHIPTLRRSGLPYEEPHVTYIGRRFKRGPYDFESSVWANPYPVERNGRRRAVALYRDHVLSSPALLARLPELEGETLGCWCGLDEACHGDVLIELLKERRGQHERRTEGAGPG
jgi:hypothetical protein